MMLVGLLRMLGRRDTWWEQLGKMGLLGRMGRLDKMEQLGRMGQLGARGRRRWSAGMGAGSQ